jgi:hypothetical protein
MTDEESYNKIYREIKEYNRIISEYSDLKADISNLMNKYEIPMENESGKWINRIEEFILKMIMELKNNDMNSFEKANISQQSEIK